MTFEKWVAHAMRDHTDMIESVDYGTCELYVHGGLRVWLEARGSLRLESPKCRMVDTGLLSEFGRGSVYDYVRAWLGEMENVRQKMYFISRGVDPYGFTSEVGLVSRGPFWSREIHVRLEGLSGCLAVESKHNELGIAASTVDLAAFDRLTAGVPPTHYGRFLLQVLLQSTDEQRATAYKRMMGER